MTSKESISYAFYGDIRRFGTVSAVFFRVFFIKKTKMYFFLHTPSCKRSEPVVPGSYRIKAGAVGAAAATAKMCNALPCDFSTIESCVARKVSSRAVDRRTRSTVQGLALLKKVELENLLIILGDIPFELLYLYMYLASPILGVGGRARWQVCLISVVIRVRELA